jgi:hypothetical protein
VTTALERSPRATLATLHRDPRNQWPEQARKLYGYLTALRRRRYAAHPGRRVDRPLGSGRTLRPHTGARASGCLRRFRIGEPDSQTRESPK